MNRSVFPGPVLRGLFLLGLLSCGMAAAWAGAPGAVMSEIRYQDRDPDQAPYTSRILVYGDFLRMDYGRDEEDFILYDGRANKVWLTAHAERRLTEIAGAQARQLVWPKAWTVRIEHQASGDDTVSQLRVNDQLCVEYKTAPTLKAEARLLGKFRQALSANQYASWLGTPEELRQACSLALDVRDAGIEYRDGLPLAMRYWDGRTRVYQGHEQRPARPELFQLPADYRRFVVGAPAQDKARARQPAASQAR